MGFFNAPSKQPIKKYDSAADLRDKLILENLNGDNLVRRAFELVYNDLDSYDRGDIKKLCSKVSQITGLSTRSVETWCINEIISRIREPKVCNIKL